MKFKWTYLFIAVVSALVGFTIYDYQHAQEAELKVEMEKRVLAFDPAQVTEFSVEAKGQAQDEAKHLKKTGDVWRVLSPFEDTADQQAVSTFLESLATEKVMEVVKAGADIDLKTYGLDAPLFSLTVNTPEGARTLKIGAVKAYDGSLFAQVGDEKKVVLVSTAWDVYLSKPARELRDKRVYRGEPQAKAKRIVLVSDLADGKHKLEFNRNEANQWSASGLGDHALREKAVDAYVEKVKALRAFDFMSIERSNKPGLKSIGLEKPGYVITVFFEGRATPFELKFAPPVSEHAAQTKAGDPQNLETLSSDLPLAVAVYKLAAQKVMVGPQEFYDPKSPFQFPVNEVTQIRINAVSVTPIVKAEFQKTEKGWEKGLQTPADSSKLNEFVTQVSRLEAVRFYDSKTSPSKSGMPSTVEFRNAKGELVFALNWGQTQIEKASGDKPEAVLLPVRTSRSKDAVAIPAASLTGLGLETL